MLIEPAPHLYGVFLALAVLIGAGVLAATAGTAGVPVRRVLVAVLALSGAALLGGRVALLVEIDQPVRIATLLQPGFRHAGALLGLLVAVPVVRRVLLFGVPLGALGDCLALALPWALAVFRLGCLAAGCCFGTPTDYPWAIRFSRDSLAGAVHARAGWIAPHAGASLPVHPLPLYFLFLAVAVGVLALVLRRRGQLKGRLLLAVLMVHELGKFLLEGFREPLVPGAAAEIVPLASLALGLVATALLALTSEKFRRAGVTTLLPGACRAPARARRPADTRGRRPPHCESRAQ